MGTGEKKKEYSSRGWLKGFLLAVLAALLISGAATIVLDPFFHYHAPLKSFFYTLSDQRSQNDGITRHFSYDAIVTGTSMVENFKTSEFDVLFGVSSVKVPYPGATYREINDNLEAAFATHDNIRYVLRGLDYSHLIEEPSLLRTDMGEYPLYLYDKNPFNDVKYLCNRSVVFEYLFPMAMRRLRGQEGGVTDFDEYSSGVGDVYGAAQALEGREAFLVNREDHTELTDKEKELVLENVRRNLAALAKEHPDTVFLYFFTPYSAVWYGSMLEEGRFAKQLGAERIAAEELLAVPNIRLFSFSADAAITTDLSQYKDAGHYSPEVSSRILERIAAGENELMQENLAAYFAEEEELYRTYDYELLLRQARE